ncbi:MAG: endonuclease III [Planctomycetes bacterium]|nr:endonuclease III [Planctomycetota bacterium]
MVRTSTDRLAEAKRHARQVVKLLDRYYPAVECALEHDNPLQLLISTILSAQCTDARVNMVTPALFRRYPTAADFAQAKLPELETLIHSTGFYRNKAKNIVACCQQLVAQHGGQVPDTLEELVKLPGVGRKTGNVVLGVAFHKAVGVVVDTHVTRLSHRLGLSRANTAEKIEQDLMAIVPREAWIALSHQLIHHGRQICQARKPDCDHCPFAEICPRIGVKTPGKKAAKPAKAPRRARAKAS